MSILFAGKPPKPSYPPLIRKENPRNIPLVEEMGYPLYEMWSPIPKRSAPPRRIPATQKMSPDPDWGSFIIGLAAGLFIGLPVGRAILGAGGRAIERRVSKY